MSHCNAGVVVVVVFVVVVDFCFFYYRSRLLLFVLFLPEMPIGRRNRRPVRFLWPSAPVTGPQPKIPWAPTNGTAGVVAVVVAVVVVAAVS